MKPFKWILSHFKPETQSTIIGTLFLVGVICLGLALMAMFGGCANVTYRHSTDNPRITGVYQPTRMAAGCCAIIAMPQCMSDAPSDSAFDPINVFTIPLGIVAFCADVPLEFVLDTVCLPYDAFQR